ncbi:MAG: hypothetical protein GY765_09780 [bacterium]|nr:hypothetical protein [bacterium]
MKKIKRRRSLPVRLWLSKTPGLFPHTFGVVCICTPSLQSASSFPTYKAGKALAFLALFS